MSRDEYDELVELIELYAGARAEVAAGVARVHSQREYRALLTALGKHVEG